MVKDMDKDLRDDVNPDWRSEWPDYRDKRPAQRECYRLIKGARPILHNVLTRCIDKYGHRVGAKYVKPGKGFDKAYQAMAERDQQLAMTCILPWDTLLACKAVPVIYMDDDAIVCTAWEFPDPSPYEEV